MDNNEKKHPILQKLEEYFKNTPKEQIDKDWSDILKDTDSEAYYEERYRAALERARELSKTVTGANYEYIFPELKKPEDEEIRRALIENFIFFGGDHLETSKWGKDDDLLVTDILAWLEKQGGQKSADEAEPKFKLYDWVVTDKGDTVQIWAVNNGYYTMGNGMDFNSFYVDRCWHKWTIQDAKDGDLIYVSTEVKGVQAIFHKFENGIIYFHCNLCGDFTQGGYEPSGDVEFVTPPTKDRLSKILSEDERNRL